MSPTYHRSDKCWHIIALIATAFQCCSGLDGQVAVRKTNGHGHALSLRSMSEPVPELASQEFVALRSSYERLEEEAIHSRIWRRGESFVIYLKEFVLAVSLLGMVLMYWHTHEKIEAYTGVKLAHMCCIVYATLSISIDLSIKHAAVAYGGNFPFNPACSVVVVEYSKLVVSAVLFAVYVARGRSRGLEVVLPKRQDIASLAIPAVIYAMNNLLVYQAIQTTPLSTFGVVRETMLIWNAVIWCVTFQQPISLTRWVAICGIFIGCSITEIPKMSNDQNSIGVLWSVVLAFSNAAGAVANEYAMKHRAQLDVNIQNCILYSLCGCFVLAGIAVLEPEYVQSPRNFFNGFVPECWQVIILQVFAGLAVSRIFKYVESVTKTVVAAIRSPSVVFLGSFLFRTPLGLSDVVATLLVSVSCWAFLRHGPLVKPPDAPISEEVRPGDPKV